jgi:hypothetical protein
MQAGPFERCSGRSGVREPRGMLVACPRGFDARRVCALFPLCVVCAPHDHAQSALAKPSRDFPANIHVQHKQNIVSSPGFMSVRSQPPFKCGSVHVKWNGNHSSRKLPRVPQHISYTCLHLPRKYTTILPHMPISERKRSPSATYSSRHSGLRRVAGLTLEIGVPLMIWGIDISTQKIHY